MSENKVKEMIEQMEEVEFEDFYSKIEEFVGKDDHSISPDTKIDARKWLHAITKIEDENDFLKGEYIPALEEKYVIPVKKKIERNKETIEFLRGGLLDFLKNSGENKVSFPDIATISLSKVAANLLYPDDEKSLAEKLAADNSPFIKIKYELDKKKIKEEFNRTEKSPIENLIIVEERETIKIRRVNRKNESEE